MNYYYHNSAWFGVSLLAERIRNWTRLAESSVLPGLLEAAATPCWRSLSSLWEKNDKKHTYREERIDRRRRLKIVANISSERNEPGRIRFGSGRAREAKPPTVPMNSTADPNSDFPWRKDVCVAIRASFSQFVKGIWGLFQESATLARCMQARRCVYQYLLRCCFYLLIFLRWVCHRKWSPNQPLSQLADLEVAPLRRANCGLPWPPCLCRREPQQLLSPARYRHLSILLTWVTWKWLRFYTFHLAVTTVSHVCVLFAVDNSGWMRGWWFRL